MSNVIGLNGAVYGSAEWEFREACDKNRRMIEASTFYIGESRKAYLNMPDLKDIVRISLNELAQMDIMWSEGWSNAYSEEYPSIVGALYQLEKEICAPFVLWALKTYPRWPKELHSSNCIKTFLVLIMSANLISGKLTSTNANHLNLWYAFQTFKYSHCDSLSPKTLARIKSKFIKHLWPYVGTNHEERGSRTFISPRLNLRLIIKELKNDDLGSQL